MKRALMTGMTVLLATICIAASCTKNKPSYKVIDPEEIITALDEIDSMVAALTGYEPKDENYVQPDVPFAENITQEAYDSAGVIWNDFVKMCKEGMFKEAYSSFLDHEGDFLMHLKHSSARYHFDTFVIMPMTLEFETEEDAVEKLINMLKLEHALELTTMKMSEGNNDYIPESLPSVINDLGMLLSSVGRLEEALEMVDDFAYAVHGLTGNPAYTNASLTFTVADFYRAAGNYDNELATLEDYITYTREHMEPNREKEECEYYISQVEMCIDSLRTGQAVQR